MPRKQAPKMPSVRLSWATAGIPDHQGEDTRQAGDSGMKGKLLCKMGRRPRKPHSKQGDTLPRGVTKGRQVWGTEGAWVSHGEQEKVPTGGVVRYHWKRRLCTSERALLRRKTSHKTIRLYLKTRFLSPPTKRTHRLNQCIVSINFKYIFVGSSTFFQGGRGGTGGLSWSGEPAGQEERPVPRWHQARCQGGTGWAMLPTPGSGPAPGWGGAACSHWAPLPATHAVSASNPRGIADLRVTFSRAFPAKPGLIPTGQ